MEDTRIRLGGVLVVWLLIALAHFSLLAAASWRKTTAHSAIELERVRAALENAEVDKRAIADASWEFKKEGWFEYSLSLPLLPILYPPDHGREAHHTLVIPAGIRFLNSLLAAFFIQAVLLAVVVPLPAGSRLRRFVEGRGLRERGAVPVVFDAAPPFALARSLERIEKLPFGGVLVVGFFHFLLTGAANIFAIAERLRSGSGEIPVFSKIMHFPLTPWIVEPGFWQTRHQFEQIKTIVTAANSLTAAIVIIFVYRLVRRRLVVRGAVAAQSDADNGKTPRERGGM